MTNYKVCDVYCNTPSFCFLLRLTDKRPSRVSPLSFSALLQDVNMSPNSSHEETNDCMIDGAAMNPAYYMGLQSTQPTAWPMPLGGDPLPLTGKPPSPAWVPAS